MLKHEERNLPLHIQNIIMKSRRRHVEKLGIKKILESEEYVRIKYVRYAANFIVGVRGSFELANKIKELIKNFLKTNLHLEINIDKTRIINTYGNKVKFLGMLIYNNNIQELPYRNARAVENIQRVARRNKIRKKNVQKKNYKHYMI